MAVLKPAHGVGGVGGGGASPPLLAIANTHLLFNPNGAIVNDLPLDVVGQLTRPEEPAYSYKRMLEIAGTPRK